VAVDHTASSMDKLYVQQGRFKIGYPWLNFY
jgi:hypothetical protein